MQENQEVSFYTSKTYQTHCTIGDAQARQSKQIYDPACGSGSLLLQAKKHFDNHIIEEGFYGQEVNPTTYNLARMNMFLHNINYDKDLILHERNTTI